MTSDRFDNETPESPIKPLTTFTEEWEGWRTRAYR